MSRRNRKPLVPGSGPALQSFKSEVMAREGFAVNPNRPDDVKYEVAQALGVPLQPQGNGQLTTEEAGLVGGRIGGTMVREMIRLAQERLSRQEEP